MTSVFILLLGVTLIYLVVGCDVKFICFMVITSVFLSFIHLFLFLGGLLVLMSVYVVTDCDVSFFPYRLFIWLSVVTSKAGDFTYLVGHSLKYLTWKDELCHVSDWESGDEKQMISLAANRSRCDSTRLMTPFVWLANSRESSCRMRSPPPWLASGKPHDVREKSDVTPSRQPHQHQKKKAGKTAQKCKKVKKKKNEKKINK